MLEVRLIGRFDIQCDGKPVILSSRAAQSLFAYLILTVGTLHRREKLAGMLWPDESEQKARAYLRNELWRIRKALPHASDVEYLLADNLTVGFNQSSVHWLDVARLKKPGDTAAAEELIDFLSSYQGELLPGFYEDWVILEREHLQVLFDQKMACLLELLEKEQRWHDILEWAERWISLGQAPEGAYRALMVAYDGLRDRAKVASTYERCVQALKVFALEPSEETRKLAFKRNPKLNIPIPLTSFIGREKELKEIAALFSKSRLITLTGSGGVGKTRLAIQAVADVLAQFPDGVWFLDLAPLSDPLLVPNTLANLVGLRELSDTELSFTDLLINYFSSRTALVIFDNCEHLIESSAQLIHSLLTSCEALSILATSREALRVAGEISYRVPSLAVPRSDTQFAVSDLANMESVRLFTERAAFVSPGFACNSQNALDIARICQRLDGIPLAIELAAARTNMLTIEQISKRLDDRFNFLTGGLRTSLPRHQTLRTLIEWSYDLLSEKDRLLFRRLAVFMGGWTLEAAQEVCSGDGIEPGEVLDLLSQLVNKSLVLVEFMKGETRYRRLETIRQFAREKLWETGEEEIMRQSHLAYFVELAERAEPNLRAFGMIMWLDRLEAEFDNIREALEYALKSDVEAELRLASALLWLWHIRGHKNEGINWLEGGLSIEATQRGDQLLTPRRAMLRGKALNASGFLVVAREIGKASPRLEESLSLFKAIGPAGNQGRAYALLRLSDMTSEPIRRRSLLEESLTLFREVGDKFGVAECLLQLLSDVQDEGDYGQALRFAEEHLALRREIGDDDGIASGLADLGHLALRHDDYQLASKLYKESLVGFRKVGNKRAIALVLSGLSNVAWAQGDYEEATRISEEALALGQDLGDKAFIARRLYGLGRVAWAQGDYAEANQKFEAALSISRETEYKPGISFSLYGVGRVAQSQEDYAKARLLYTEAIGICQERRDPFSAALHLEALATLAAAQKQMERAARLFGTAETLFPPIRLELSAEERAEYDEAVATTRAALGEQVFTTVWEEGQKMTLDEAVAYAIESL